MKYAGLMTALLLGAASYGHANEFADAVDKMCEKMKSCALQQLEQKKGVDPQMKAMVTQMTDQMCASMRQQYNPGAETHPLYEPALRCMQSMAEMDCAMLEKSSKTKACEEMEAMSK